MKSVTLLFVFFILSINVSNGQVASRKTGSAPFVMGVVDSIKSIELSEARALNIYLPEDYSKENNVKYPVIYLLDGSANEDFIHIVGLVQFLIMIKVMPPSIVVGIANVDRKRDFTFPTKNKEDLKNYPTTGGSAKFMLFIEKELEPYIRYHYRTNEQKTIIGQSLGGLLATEILLKKPALFNNYIIVSPSLWWDDESLLSVAPGLLKMFPASDIKVYVSVGGEEEVQMQSDADKLVSMLRAITGNKLTVSYVPLPEESHLTILHRSVYKAFEILNQKQ